MAGGLCNLANSHTQLAGTAASAQAVKGEQNKKISGISGALHKISSADRSEDLKHAASKL